MDGWRIYRHRINFVMMSWEKEYRNCSDMAPFIHIALLCNAFLKHCVLHACVLCMHFFLEIGVFHAEKHSALCGDGSWWGHTRPVPSPSVTVSNCSDGGAAAVHQQNNAIVWSSTGTAETIACSVCLLVSHVWSNGTGGGILKNKGKCWKYKESLVAQSDYWRCYTDHKDVIFNTQFEEKEYFYSLNYKCNINNIVTV